MTTRARGRRPGTPDTKAAILAAARAQFASAGFSGTTIRAVAAEAGVDAALVHHYFGTKDDLFVAALELPVDPRVVLAPAIAQGPDGAGERILRIFMTTWDDPAHRLPMLGFVRTPMEPPGRRLVQDGFLDVVIAPIGVALGIDQPERRMPLVASQMFGLIILRYLLEVEPLASLSHDEVVAIYGPTIQRYLTGPLP